MTRSARRLVLGAGLSLSVFAFLLGACASATDHPPPGETGSSGNVVIPEAGEGGTREGGAGFDSGKCPMVKQEGKPITQLGTANGAPPTGGKIVPGKYILTALAYSGAAAGMPTGLQAEYTLLIDEDTYLITGVRVAGMVNETAAQNTFIALSYNIEGTKLKLGVICPNFAAYPQSVGYSVAGNTLTIHKNEFDREVFTKQP